MVPRSPARRFPPFGCAALVAAALALPACGEDGGAAAKGDVATQAARAGAAPAREACPRQLGDLLASLGSLRRRLAVGLSYEQYAAAMRDLRASYAEIPVERLTIDCLAQAGGPSERALNRYIDAANAWGECLADASCTTASIEPVLQRQWRLASGFLSAAR